MRKERCKRTAREAGLHTPARTVGRTGTVVGTPPSAARRPVHRAAGGPSTDGRQTPSRAPPIPPIRPSSTGSVSWWSPFAPLTGSFRLGRTGGSLYPTSVVGLRMSIAIGRDPIPQIAFSPWADGKCCTRNAYRVSRGDFGDWNICAGVLPWYIQTLLGSVASRYGFHSTEFLSSAHRPNIPLSPSSRRAVSVDSDRPIASQLPTRLRDIWIVDSSSNGIRGATQLN